MTFTFFNREERCTQLPADYDAVRAFILDTATPR